MRIRSLACLVLAPALLSGCNLSKSVDSVIRSVTNFMTSPEIEISQLKPARNTQLLKNNIRRVAVTSSDRRRDKQIETQLESALANVDVKGAPYFTLIDRTAIDRVIDEQRFSHSDLADQNNRIKLGKLLGADAIVSLNSDISSVETSRYSESRVRCKDKDCDEKEDYTVSCSKKIVSAQITPKITAVESGQIVFTRGYQDTAESRHCSDSGVPHLTRTELTNTVLERVFSGLIYDIAPHQVTFKAPLIEKDDSNLNENAEALLKKGIKFAENEWIDEACDAFVSAQSAFSHSLAINYNNGVCAERAGDIESAFAFYQNALNTTQDLDDLIPVRNGLKRVRARKEELKVLAQLEESGRL